MSVIGSNVLAGASGSAGAAGYEITRSLRFNSADSAYLSRTFASAGNRRTWTWSGWVKRSKPSGGGYQTIFSSTATNYGLFYFNGSDSLEFYNESSGAALLVSTQVFRDFSAWYHFVFRFDTTESTAANRLRAYVNGVEITSWSYDTRATYLTQNLEGIINSAIKHEIGGETTYNRYLGGYLAEVNFIDGQALAATDFGEYDDNNVWQPKAYSGTYGTNGFHLDFSDNSSASALGTDSSGNSNTWTVNNLSVASGAGNDSLIDTPTNYTAASGNNGGNYATLNPLKNQSQTLKNGNLESNGTSGRSTGTLYASSGKFYWEFTAGTDYTMAGIESSTSPQAASYPGENDQQYALYGNAGSGLLFHNGSTTSVDGFVSGDVIGVALDMDGGNLYFYKNGTAMNSGSAVATGLTGAWTANCRSGSGGFNGDTIFNFGQRPFAYTPPTGYVSLCTTNLPDPTIADGSTAMDVALRTADTSQTTSVTGLAFSPDLIWEKVRSNTSSHYLVDTIRGISKTLSSNTSGTELTYSSFYTSFNTDGYSIGTGDFATGRTVVGWVWDAGADSSKTYTVKVVSDGGNKFRFDDFGTSAVTLDLEEGSTYVFDQSDSSNATHPLRFATAADAAGGTEYTTGVTTTGTPGQAGAKTTITVASGAPTLYYYCSSHTGMGGQANTNSTAGASNFAGSIQSTVRANASAGFSIVSYTPTTTGGNATIGHGLGVSPGMIIARNRDRSWYWAVYHSSLGIAKFAKLNTTDAAITSGIWGSTINSNIFSIGADFSNGYQANERIIAYCFAPVSQYSSFGVYTGNGSTDGPFIYTGFRPKFYMYKRTDTTGSWVILDADRAGYNVVDKLLFPDLSSAESTFSMVDFCSNGIKIRNNYTSDNGSGGTFIYAAFAEHPFSLNGGLAR